MKSELLKASIANHALQYPRFADNLPSGKYTKYPANQGNTRQKIGRF